MPDTLPHWHDVLFYLPGRARPSSLGLTARENLLAAWASGDGRQVARVTDEDGRELDPREIDWGGMDPPPVLRVGQRLTTGRGSGHSAQVLVRLSMQERDRCVAAASRAGASSVASWARELMLRAAAPE